MAFGLECYSSTGALTLGVSDRLARFHGTFSITGVGFNYSGFVSVPGYTNDGTWFYLVPGAANDGVVVTPTTDGFNVSHNASGPTPGGSYTIYVWRG